MATGIQVNVQKTHMYYLMWPIWDAKAAITVLSLQESPENQKPPPPSWGEMAMQQQSHIVQIFRVLFSPHNKAWKTNWE